MTRISTPGANKDSGYVLLRALVIVFIVLFCFASVLGAAAFFAHRSWQLLEEVRTEIRERNTATGRLLLSP